MPDRSHESEDVHPDAELPDGHGAGPRRSARIVRRLLWDEISVVRLHGGTGEATAPGAASGSPRIARLVGILLAVLLGILAGSNVVGAVELVRRTRYLVALLDAVRGAGLGYLAYSRIRRTGSPRRTFMLLGLCSIAWGGIGALSDHRWSTVHRTSVASALSLDVLIALVGVAFLVVAWRLTNVPSRLPDPSA